MLSIKEKKEFVKKVNKAPDGIITCGLDLKKLHERNIQIIFNQLKKDYPIDIENELTVEDSLLKVEGQVRLGGNNYTTDKIKLYIESIFYSYCANAHHTNDETIEAREWLRLLCNTIAHEYCHSIQKSKGKDMSDSSGELEKEADKFADEITAKYLEN